MGTCCFDRIGSPRRSYEGKPDTINHIFFLNWREQTKRSRFARRPTHTEHVHVHYKQTTLAKRMFYCYFPKKQQPAPLDSYTFCLCFSGSTARVCRVNIIQSSFFALSHCQRVNAKNKRFKGRDNTFSCVKISRLFAFVVSGVLHSAEGDMTSRARTWQQFAAPAR